MPSCSLGARKVSTQLTGFEDWLGFPPGTERLMRRVDIMPLHSMFNRFGCPLKSINATANWRIEEDSIIAGFVFGQQLDPY